MSAENYNVVEAHLDFVDGDKSFQREVCFFATPDRIISLTSSGNSGGVAFDFFKIREELIVQGGGAANGAIPEFLYMVHSHPPGCNRMSSTDMNMVYGWCLAWGVPIMFIIVTEEEIVHYVCTLDKDNKIDRKFLSAGSYYDNTADMVVAATILYGLSKAEHLLKQDQYDCIANMMNEAALSFCSELELVEQH